MTLTSGVRDELERVRRVSDSLCSAHANLRDRLMRRATILDVLILGLSTWLAALAFVDPHLEVTLTPFDWNSRIWTGTLATATFFLTIIQLKTDWKARSDAHRRTLDLYAEVKREAGYAAAADEIDNDSFKRILSRYDLASAAGIEVPEREFLKQKRRHKTKIALSKYLDDHPSASITLTKLKFWFRDNISGQ